MRRNHNCVFWVMLVVMIGLCLLPSRAEALSKILNESLELESLGIYGNYATVDVLASSGHASFFITLNFDVFGSEKPLFTEIWSFTLNSTLDLLPDCRAEGNCKGDASDQFWELPNHLDYDVSGGNWSHPDYYSYTVRGWENPLGHGGPPSPPSSDLFAIRSPNITGDEDEFFVRDEYGHHYYAHINYYFPNFPEDRRYLSTTLTDAKADKVPEPTTLVLLGSGLIGLAGYGRKKLFKR